MLRKMSSLFECTIQTKDGENLGKVDDLYFDSTDWTIPYVVVNLDAWLFGRRVLISTLALDKSRWDYTVLTVALTKAEVKDSPHIDLTRPVTRMQASELYRYYDWPSDSNPRLTTAVGLSVAGVGSSLPELSSADIPRVVIDAPEKTEASHVHSAHKVLNDTIEASDRTSGRVADLILDDEAWVIRYLLVNTGNWRSGKKVLLSPRWVKQIDWSKSQI